MNVATPTAIAKVEPLAWRITFTPTLAQGQQPLVTVKEPVNLFAVAEAVDFAAALAEPRAGANSTAPAIVPAIGTARRHQESAPQPAATERPLLLLCSPLSSSLAYDIEPRLEAWLSEGSDAPVPLVRAGLRTSRVLWSSDRAIIYAPPEQMRDAMDAVIRFTVTNRETSRLESTIAAMWPVLAEHVPLTHAVTRQQRRLQPLVNAMTEQATAMMSTLLRLETALEQLDPAFTIGSKRLGAELIEQAALYDRLELLEGPVEHVGDIYELANSRLTESRFAAQNNTAERVIALFLAVELALMVFGLLTPGAHLF
jgi:hypothetical protein